MRTTLPPVQPLSHDSPLEPPRPIGLGGVYPSVEARAAMLAIYDAKLAEWPVPHEELDLPTRYGSTHVVAAGDPAGPPLLMVHMHACTAFMWSPIVAPLAARFRVYAVDTIGDVNKSVLADPAHRARSGDELAEWLGEVADALRITRSDVIAGSYGGWLAMHYASHLPERVRRLVLVVPMGLPGWPQTARVLLRLSTTLVRLTPEKLERTLRYLMGDEPAMRRLAQEWFTQLFAWRCTPDKVPAPRPVPARRLAAIGVPTLVILGGRDPLIGDAGRAAARARRHIPRVEVEVVPHGTHAVHGEASERVSTRMLEFLAP